MMLYILCSLVHHRTLACAKRFVCVRRVVRYYGTVPLWSACVMIYRVWDDDSWKECWHYANCPGDGAGKRGFARGRNVRRELPQRLRSGLLAARFADLVVFRVWVSVLIISILINTGCFLIASDHSGAERIHYWPNILIFWFKMRWKMSVFWYQHLLSHSPSKPEMEVAT